MFLLYDALPDPSLSVLNAVTKNGVNLCTVVYLVVGDCVSPICLIVKVNPLLPVGISEHGGVITPVLEAI